MCVLVKDFGRIGAGSWRGLRGFVGDFLFLVVFFVGFLVFWVFSVGVRNVYFCERFNSFSCVFGIIVRLLSLIFL